MPYSRILKDPNLRASLPFKYANKEMQQKLLSEITNRKDIVDDDEADEESDPEVQYLNQQIAKS